ncbi:UNKNOWN [Stylonychia lemnae]|uniref:Uncharacterized protein n=1 Tax=Stylonychia lemnae TaxID=5949 RepID=A0A078ARX9_STYLE|nr:UNKNOWN [Stylonychia lemnae]|eukprot:CDW84929.1 UNKNOWN [Stylonychia lemnae]
MEIVSASVSVSQGSFEPYEESTTRSKSQQVAQDPEIAMIGDDSEGQIERSLYYFKPPKGTPKKYIDSIKRESSKNLKLIVKGIMFVEKQLKYLDGEEEQKNDSFSINPLDQFYPEKSRNKDSSIKVKADTSKLPFIPAIKLEQIKIMSQTQSDNNFKEILQQYKEEFKQVFKGFDSKIDPKSIQDDIKKQKSNRYYTLMKNMKYVGHMNPYKRNNPDLDELRGKLEGEQFAKIQKKLAKIDQDKNQIPEENHQLMIPDSQDANIGRSNSLQQLFHNEVESNRRTSKRNLTSRNTSLSLQKKIKQNQSIDMIYFDSKLNSSRIPPKVYRLHESTPLHETKLVSPYTIKDITQKDSDIKKVFEQIAPEKFKKKKKIFNQVKKIKEESEINVSDVDYSPNYSQTKKAYQRDVSQIFTQKFISEMNTNEKQNLDQSMNNMKIKSRRESKNATNMSYNPDYYDMNSTFRQDHSLNLSKSKFNPNQSRFNLKSVLKNAKSLKTIEKIDSKLIKPFITPKDDALSVLKKFQDLHRYNMHNTMRKINTMGRKEFKAQEDLTYEDFYLKNKNTVSKQLDEDHSMSKFRLDEKKIPEKLLNQMVYNVERDKLEQKQRNLQELTLEIQKSLNKSQSNINLPNLKLPMMSPTSKQPEIHNQYVKSLNQSLDKIQSVSPKKKIVEFGPLSFYKFKDMFPNKKQDYDKMVQDPQLVGSEQTLKSYNKVLKHVLSDTHNLIVEKKLKERDLQLREQEKLVELQLKHKNVDQEQDKQQEDRIKQIFKRQLKLLQKNPLYQVNYKREHTIQDSKIVRENAILDAKVIKMQNQQNDDSQISEQMEKRDMFLNRAHKQDRKRFLLEHKIINR